MLTVFLCGTILATIYLGWHFAVDDVAGLAIAWVSVRLGRCTAGANRWRSSRPLVRLPAGGASETPAHGDNHT